ncbi:MAG: phosphomannose isomerase type II C-terminal cupin domain [Acidobacteriota bacterium]
MSEDPSHRPWGHYEVLLDEASYKVKRIVVNPGKRLSLQRHRRRQEHWFFVEGQGVVTVDGHERPVGAAVAVDIPLGAAHRVANCGERPLVFIEVQTGSYFGEDDIERFADDYGRV